AIDQLRLELLRTYARDLNPAKPAYPLVDRLAVRLAFSDGAGPLPALAEAEGIFDADLGSEYVSLCKAKDAPEQLRAMSGSDFMEAMEIPWEEVRKTVRSAWAPDMGALRARLPNLAA